MPVLPILTFDRAEAAFHADGSAGAERLFHTEYPLHTEYPAFIATKGIYHKALASRLEAVGFETIIPVTVDVDNELRNAYVRKVFAADGRPFVKMEQQGPRMKSEQREPRMEQPACPGSVCVYMAKSIYDKPLQSGYLCPDYERPIQVGAALTRERLEPGILTDCEGENISAKNRQYCELTAMYWIWKHAKEDIVGLTHYRRHFLLPQGWQRGVAAHEIGVILPVPSCAWSDIGENYRQRHDAADWDFCMRYLKENRGREYETAKKVFAGSLYSPCNMFIMRKEILDELCAWMFPILDAVTEHGGTKEDTYLNRYAGFVSERLITLFFVIHQKRYKIIYADKNFIS